MTVDSRIAHIRSVLGGRPVWLFRDKEVIIIYTDGIFGTHHPGHHVSTFQLQWPHRKRFSLNLPPKAPSKVDAHVL
jgi:hypothetical protein